MKPRAMTLDEIRDRLPDLQSERLRKIEGLKIQFQMRQAHLMRACAEVTSGAYKLRTLFHGFSDEKPFTEQEKFEHAWAEVKRHEELLGEIEQEILKLLWED